MSSGRVRPTVVVLVVTAVLASLLGACSGDGEGGGHGIELGIPAAEGADADEAPPTTDAPQDDTVPPSSPPDEPADDDGGGGEGGGGSDGSDDEAERFCETMRSEQERIVEQLEGSQAGMQGEEEADFGDALIALVGIVQAIGELRTYFGELEAVAPDEIRPELEIVADEYDEQLDAAEGAASDPLGAIAAGIISGITISGPMNTLNEYALQHCGQSI